MAELDALESQIEGGKHGRALSGGALATKGFNKSGSSSFGDSASMASVSGYDVETVYAPPGKLGVVVDSLVSGPQVHAVRDTSPLLGIVRVGDMILR